MFRCRACGAINRVPASKRNAGPICGRCKAEVNTTGAPQDVDGQALRQAVASSPVPVLVDFWAPWCGPCRMASPIVDQVSREQAGEVLTLKLNTEDDHSAAAQYGIRGIPTFILFKDGREVDRRSGAMPRAVLTQWLSPHLGRGEDAAHL